jgi:hypothetical protein
MISPATSVSIHTELPTTLYTTHTHEKLQLLEHWRRNRISTPADGFIFCRSSASSTLCRFIKAIFNTLVVWMIHVLWELGWVKGRMTDFCCLTQSSIHNPAR